MSKVKIDKKVDQKKPLMVKKSKASDYDENKKDSLSATDDYKDFGKLERPSAKAKVKSDGRERRDIDL
jgi:hypothetical protein